MPPMKIGVPKEIKNSENRVGLLPSGVRQLVLDGQKVFVQSQAGMGIGISDETYKKAGATILSSLEEIFDQSEMIIKVKEPQPQEIALLRPHHILYTFLHLAADKQLTTDLMETGSTCIAYETIQNPDGSLPLLHPMSEVAGRMAAQVGASHLEIGHGGKGVLLGGVPGTKRARVTVIGCGVAGSSAIKIARGLGAEVIAIDLSTKRLAKLEQLYENITTLFSNIENIESSVVSSDLVIGAALVPGAKAPCLVSKKIISQMEKGSVVVDIAVDQGGCTETCRPTTHENPTFIINGVIHYCVSNIPGIVPRTSTYALTNCSLKHARLIAKEGVRGSATKDSALKQGINIYKGKMVYQQIAEDLDLPYTTLDF